MVHVAKAPVSKVLQTPGDQQFLLLASLGVTELVKEQDFGGFMFQTGKLLLAEAGAPCLSSQVLAVTSQAGVFSIKELS